MSNKCKWEDGKFVACKGSYSVTVLSNGNVDSINFCPFCGADIRKPESEVIIKRSGGTWVARYDGVDYICTDGRRSGDLKDDFSVDHIERWWSPIATIKITDDIAKLRPMVVGEYEVLPAVWKEDTPEKLIYVSTQESCCDDNVLEYYVVEGSRYLSCRLATVGDL